MTFHEFDDLRTALAAADFDRPPAFVANAHVTGLSVARALDDHDVPVVALDRSGDGAAPPSTAVDYAGNVTYPLDDETGFREDVEALAGDWRALASGDFETTGDLTTAVYRPSDPAPIAHRLDVEFGGRDYYCSC